MQKELLYFTVDGDYGWDQDKFPEFMMRLGGCAIVTACDCCVYFRAYGGITEICPMDTQKITREGYLSFAGQMKAYLAPRAGGYNTLEMYMEKFGKYLDDVGCRRVGMRPLHGEQSADEAKAALKGQIDRGLPVPILVLRHRNSLYKDYSWHWFILTGYRSAGNQFQVKAVSYGSFVWFDFDDLWDSGYEKKGGLILFDVDKGESA